MPWYTTSARTEYGNTVLQVECLFRIFASSPEEAHVLFKRQIARLFRLVPGDIAFATSVRSISDMHHAGVSYWVPAALEVEGDSPIAGLGPLVGTETVPIQPIYEYSEPYSLFTGDSADIPNGNTPPSAVDPVGTINMEAFMQP